MDDSREDLDTLQRDPYSSYAQARQTTGLTFVPPLNTWLVAWDADACEVLRRPQDFSSANALCPDVPPTPAVLAELTNGIGRGAHRGHLRRRGTDTAVVPASNVRVIRTPGMVLDGGTVGVLSGITVRLARYRSVRSEAG